MLQLVVCTMIMAASAAAVTVVMPQPPLARSGWSATAPTPPTEIVSVVLVAKPRNLRTLHELATAVSTPGHPQHKQFLTTEQVNTLTAPLPGDIAAITAWASSVTTGVTVDRQQGIVTIKCTAAEAEALFQTSFRQLTHAATARVVHRATRCSLPGRVAAASAAVFGMHRLPLPPRGGGRGGGGRAVVSVGPPADSPSIPPPVAPDVIDKLYKIDAVHSSGSENARVAVAEFQGQQMDPADLAKFSACLCRPRRRPTRRCTSLWAGAPTRAATGQRRSSMCSTSWWCPPESRPTSTSR